MTLGPVITVVPLLLLVLVPDMVLGIYLISNEYKCSFRFLLDLHLLKNRQCLVVKRHGPLLGVTCKKTLNDSRVIILDETKHIDY